MMRSGLVSQMYGGAGGVHWPSEHPGQWGEESAMAKRGGGRQQPEDKTVEERPVPPEVETSAEAGARKASSEEAEQIGRLTGKVEALESEISRLQAALATKNETIADMEIRLKVQARKIGVLTVGAVRETAADALAGMTEQDFKDARRKGVTHFVVLRPWKGWDGSVFDKGQGIDARQYGQLHAYVGNGMALAPMPESEAGA